MKKGAKHLILLQNFTSIKESYGPKGCCLNHNLFNPYLSLWINLLIWLWDWLAWSTE